MNVPEDGHNIIDPDAPTLQAEVVTVGGAIRWRVWCRYCNGWHYHSPGEGHREAHCSDPSGEYFRTGYNLVGACHPPHAR